MRAVTFKSKGKFYGMGDGTDYTGEWAIQPADKVRFQINFEANGMKLTFKRLRGLTPMAFRLLHNPR